MATATETKPAPAQTLGTVLENDKEVRTLRRVLRQINQLGPESLALLKQQMKVR